MGMSAVTGPVLSFGVSVKNSTDGITGISADYNDQRAPSVSDLGFAMMDPRAAFNYEPGASVANSVYAFYGNKAVVDYVPLTANTSNIVSNTASSGVSAFTLVTASSAAGTYTTSLTAPENGTTISSILTLDSSADALRYNSFGQSGTIKTWSPGWGTGRCIAVVTSTYADTAVVVSGRDAYGFKITESIPISSNGSATSSFGGISRKAFKYVTAVTNSTTAVSTGILVGTTNRFGVPLYVPYVGGNITVIVSSTAGTQNAAVALSTATFTLAQASTATATSTTADVRGVYISSLASDGTVRLYMEVTPSASAVTAVTPADVSPLFGATQYSA